MDLITLILFIIGFVLLITGAEFLVRGASKLAIAIGISPLVVGLTVVAYGTSAPELAVTIQATFAGQSDLALGNVVGSNISNVLLVLGLSAVLGSLLVAQKLVRFEIPLMIALSVLILLIGLDGVIGWIDGLILFGGAMAYTFFVIRQSRKENKLIQAEYEQEFDGQKAKILGPLDLLRQAGLIVLGLGMLILGSKWLIDGAVATAEFLGVSQLIIGLTVVAVGTSLPEIATSVIASIRGERDIAVGNVVGSNIFNILSVLGLTGIIAPTGVLVSTAALSFDIPVMIVVAVACLPIFFTNYSIDRWEGFLFLGYYAAYTAYLYLQATQHDALPMFNGVMLLFVTPITIITIVIVVVRNIQANRQTLVKESIPLPSDKA